MATWFRIPYRWSKRPFTNIKWILEDLFWVGPRNVLRWIPVIWMDADFDYSSLLEVMEFKFKKMAESHEQDTWHPSAPRYARQLRTVELLCRRMNSGITERSDNVSKFYKYGSTAWAKEISAIEKQDQEMLGKLIGKYITHWWD